MNPVRTRPVYTPDICQWEVINSLCAHSHRCAVKPFHDILHLPECGLDKLNNFLNCLHLRSKKQISTDICPTPCSYARYDVELSAVEHKDPGITPYLQLGKPDKHDEMGDPTNHTFIEVIISPKEMEVTRMSHVPEVTVLDILSSFGGLMGLFLGASVLTLTEFLETLLATCLIMYSRCCRRGGETSRRKC